MAVCTDSVSSDNSSVPAHYEAEALTSVSHSCPAPIPIKSPYPYQHDFKTMEFIKDEFDWPPRRAVQPLKVLIIGAGIAGLTTGIGLQQTGHQVIILEQVWQINEVGAGKQLAPNATRILARFGVLEEVMKYATILEKNNFRRYSNDGELGTAPLMPGIGRKYGAPLSVIHRGDLQEVLLDSAKKAGVEIRTDTKVIAIDSSFKAKVQTESGGWFEGDLVFAADGIKSNVRRQILEHHGCKDSSISTGDAAYRILIPEESMHHDTRAVELLKQNIGMRWMGPGGHIMAYPIKNNTVYNMVLIHPATLKFNVEEPWTSQGDKSEMMHFYKDWNDTVINLLSYVPEGAVMEWVFSQDGGRSARCGQCLCNDPNSPCPNGRVPGKSTSSKRSAKMYLESSTKSHHAGGSYFIRCI